MRANRALIASIRLIGSTRRTVRASQRCAYRRPVQTSCDLDEASDLLVRAAAMLRVAEREIVETVVAIIQEPEPSRSLSSLLSLATERWLELSTWLREASAEVSTVQENVLRALETGVLVPERPADRRPRIALVPRPVPIRAFLQARQPRVLDRIASILRRRRRTPRPAALTAPPNTDQGRAPPLSSVCLL